MINVELFICLILEVLQQLPERHLSFADHPSFPALTLLLSLRMSINSKSVSCHETLQGKNIQPTHSIIFYSLFFFPSAFVSMPKLQRKDEEIFVD